jgi:glucose/arabinose dehydrogenase
MARLFKAQPLSRAKFNLFEGNIGVLLISLIVLFVSCKKDLKPSERDNPINAEKNASLKKEKAVEATVTVFATGFNDPRGLKFGPDGYLYVAEAGVGGTTSSVGLCPGLEGEEYFGSPTGGGISKVSPEGVRTTITNNLPTSVGEGLLGVADVAFIGNTLYALLNGAGCSHGVPTVPNGIIKINANGTFDVVADLGSWQVTHPVANPAADFEPEGTWYSMVSIGNSFYALDPNHGELVMVTTDGSITRVADISETQGHIVPTALDHRGNFYVGNLGLFPITEGSSSIYKITPSGETKVVETGFTTIVGLVFDNRARMYVLENTTGNLFPTPFTGRIVRVNPNGTKDVIASGLALPTAMTYGPDGNLYVSNWGFGAGPGGGQILKVTLQ